MPRSLDQNKRIWKLVGQLAQATGLGREWAEEIMRAHCKEVTGQTSTRNLTVSRADELIARLEAAVEKIVIPAQAGSHEHAGGFRVKHGTTKKKPPSKEARQVHDGEAFTTPQMERMAKDLFADLGWATAAQQRGFYKRVLGKDTIGPITRADHLKIIEGLKAIWLRKNKQKIARAHLAIAELHQNGTGLTPWERGFIKDVRAKIKTGKKLTPQIILKVLEINDKRLVQSSRGD